MRRVPKWVGLLYVVLVGVFLAWYIARGHQVDYLIAVVAAFTGLLALPAAVIAVLRPRESGPEPARLEDVADQLAQGVRQQWEAEAQVRRLNDPFPLSVEWVAAEADLVESWPHLRELAGDWPGQPPEATSTWIVSPRGLAGGGGDIAQVFERVPTRRLVILGEPGAGKTMLLIRLLLALLERRPPDGPVPFLFPLAAWDPAQQDLHTWMADQLAQDHPALRAPAIPPQASTGTQARALLQQRLILPILDGLDELPQALSARALHAINQALPAGQPLVLSSRTAEYRHALTTQAGTTVLLNGAAGIQLLPLDPAKAAAYLERDAGGPNTEAAARWRRVTASLSTDTPASQALSTPLGLFLARTIYNPRPDEDLASLSGLSDPNELFDQARFPTRQDIDTHLFAAFIPAAYRPHPHHPTRWTAQKAQRTLTFLARHLQHTFAGTPNLAWWQLPKAHPQHGQALAVGLTAGLVGWFPFVFLMWLTGLLSTGIEYGLMFGLLWAVMATRIASSARERNPSSGIRWSWRGKAWLTVGVPSGLIFGFVFAAPSVARVGWTAWLLYMLAIGLPFTFLGGIRPVRPALDKAVGPGVVLSRDRRTFSALTLAGALMGMLAEALRAALGLWFEGEPQLAFDLAFGLAVGFPVGLMLGLAGSVGMVFLVAQIRLAVLGHVPWHLMSFLADAHQRRGVLRQVGAVYQFRHIDLQRHLAGHQP
ncbi:MULTISPECIES: NACHT domain-containing protein [unclassified Streptomyces]|uniref:NACHT domain-containing protein n=1 Tax=unclassified Streptomyces TaxID=2593676 RepID=UPI002E82267C|nr:NACHT domain-containing protein [Streptomyces sp. NBC_00589]WTI42368.1 NACHT domain-containing protein [Streptomyces sp. NBC_00775]WUB23950.1 NACHT domain-containing protein [Streptomyces sp. NBC_00589]